MIREDWSTLKKLMFMTAAGSKAVEDTASGNPLSFITDKAKPLKSLLIPFTPIQSGTGDPSPSNIRSIIPWNGLTVWQAGANLADFEIIQGGIAGADGNENSSPFRIKTKDTFFIKGGGTKYTIDAKGVDKVWIYNYNPDGTYASTQDSQGFKSLPYTYTRNGSDCRLKLAFCMEDQDQRITPSVISEIRFEVGTTFSSFETAHVSEHKAVFPSPVYGGILDVVSGVLTVTHGIIVLDENTVFNSGAYATSQDLIGAQINKVPNIDTSSPITSILCDKLIKRSNSNEVYSFIRGDTGYFQIFVGKISEHPEITNANEAKAFTSEWVSENPVTVVYPLATPQEIQLTPAQITALVGDNTIWSDAYGSMTAVYLKKG